MILIGYSRTRDKITQRRRVKPSISDQSKTKQQQIPPPKKKKNPNQNTTIKESKQKKKKKTLKKQQTIKIKSENKTKMNYDHQNNLSANADCGHNLKIRMNGLVYLR